MKRSHDAGPLRIDFRVIDQTAERLATEAVVARLESLDAAAGIPGVALRRNGIVTRMVIGEGVQPAARE